MLPTFPAGLAPAAGQLNLAAAAGDPSTAADRWPSPEAAQVMPADAAPAGGSLAQHQSKPQQHTPAQAVAHTSAAAAAGTADPAASTAILQTSSAQQSSPHAALPGQLSAQPRPGPAPAEAAAMQHQQLATGVLPAPDQRVTSDNSSSGGAGAASAPPAAGNLSAQTATAGAADRPAATCPDAQAAATWRTAAAGMTLPAPAAAPESGLISALAAIIRQQDLKQQQQGLSTGAADAGATSVPARMGFRAPAVAVTPVGGSLQGSRSSSQPLASPADLLNLLLGLGRGTAMPQAVAPAPAALAAADALSGGGTAAWPQQQGQQMMSSLPGSAQGTFPAAFTAAPGLPGASSARREAGPPSSLAVAAALAALGPASVPRAAPAAAAAAAAGLSAARPMGAHALMKRKASGSLPSSPVVLSTYNSPRGLAGSSADAAGGASGCAGEVGSGVLRGQMPGMQLPPHPRGCFSGSAYEAGSGPAAAVIAASTAAGASGGAGARRTGAVSSALHEPQAWTGLAAAAAGAGGIGLRGFPTRATREAEAEGREEGDLNDLLLQATAAALHAAKAPTGSRGGVGNLAGKGRVEELQVAAAADGGEDMEVDVSPTMAAAAAAMSGLARLGSSGLGGESAAGRLRSKAAAASAAAAAALGGTASAKKKAAAHSRKAMQVDAGSSGGASGGGAAGGIMGAHQDPSVADAAAAAAALTAVAAAGMLAGSLNWGRQWYDGSSNQSAAAAAGEGGGDAGGLFAGSGYSWGGLMPGETGSWLQDNLVGTVPWPAQLAAGQQVVHKSRGQSAGGKAAGVPKSRAPRAKKEASDPSYVPRRVASPTAAARGVPGSRGGAGAAAAAGAADTAVGGKKKCKSSTSRFRGVTQHRYTLRWEAHLWDPDAIRSKTAGSARTKGKQTYLGGYPSEAEAAHAYDRAALVYWGDGSITNYPKEPYAGEMHLLAALTREQVVLNIRAISHANQKFVPQRPGVFPHQALPRIFEARLYDAAHTTYQYLGAYASEEAASKAVAEALQQQQQQQQQAFAAAQAAVEAQAAEAAGTAHTGVPDAMTAAGAPS